MTPRKEAITFYLEPEKVERLLRLAIERRVPRAVILREMVDRLLGCEDQSVSQEAPTVRVPRPDSRSPEAGIGDACTAEIDLLSIGPHDIRSR